MALFGPDGRELTTPAAVEQAPAAVLRRYAAAVGETPERVSERAGALLLTGFMLLYHVEWLLQESGATQDMIAEALHDVASRAQALAVELGPAMRCKVCGCTALSPCDQQCWWVEPYRCSQCVGLVAGQKEGAG